jgi:hypothetical protein
MLHTCADGSILRTMSAKDLAMIPIWKGNRTLDTEHAKQIQEGVGKDIESLGSTVFRIIQYNEPDTSGRPVLQNYIIDGQHRVYVLREHFQNNLCERDFQALVFIKTAESESDAIDFFNRLNNVKPQQWEHDPNMLANKYISALCNNFNTDKKNLLIRQGVTKRPFLSSDVLREMLVKKAAKLSNANERVDLFVTQVKEWNAKALVEMDLKLLNDREKKNHNLLESALNKKFALAYDVKLPWVNACI